MIKQKCQGKSVIEANKIRIQKIKEVKQRGVEYHFINIKKKLDENESVLTYMEDNLFFEKIDNVVYEHLETVWKRIDSKKREELISQMKESYMLRGERGYRFSITTILLRIDK